MAHGISPGDALVPAAEWETPSGHGLNRTVWQRLRQGPEGLVSHRPSRDKRAVDPLRPWRKLPKAGVKTYWDGKHHRLGMLGHPNQKVPHEVNAAPLSANARQHLPDGALGSPVGIRGDQANAPWTGASRRRSLPFSR